MSVAPSPPADTQEPEAEPASPISTSPTSATGDPKGAPAELNLAQMHRMFVTSDMTSLCPTREQATARKCGNSLAGPNQGVVKKKGTLVLVAGDAPVDGLWRSVRFQKAGNLPSWVRADDLAKIPALPFLDEWDKRSDLEGALDATTLPAKKLARVRKGKLVKWHRVAAPTLGEDAKYTHVYLDLGKAGWIALRLPPPRPESAYISHYCLLAADCLQLSYVCDKTYCDSVSILAKATGKKVPPPEDLEKEWTGGKKRMPVFETVAFADRFGVFEATDEK